MAEAAAVDQPIPFRLLLDEAMKQVRRHFRAVYFPVAVPLALVSGLIPLAQVTYFRFPGERGDSGPIFPGFLNLMLVTAVALLVYSLGYNTLLVGAVEALSGRAISMKRAWGVTLRPRVLGTLLLSWFLIVAGLVCCMIPGLYVGLLLSLIMPVMVEEGRFGRAALRRSYELITYNPRRDFTSDPRLKAFVVLFAGGLLGYAIGFAITLPLIVLQQVAIFRNLASGTRMDPNALVAEMAWLQVPTSVLATLARVAVSLYVSFGLALLFFDIRHRKEGVELEEAIGRLAGAPPAAGAPSP